MKPRRFYDDFDEEQEPDPHQSNNFGSVEAQSEATEGRGDHNGGKEVQNGGVEAENAKGSLG